MLRQILEVIGLHDFRCFLHVAQFVEFDTSIICHVLVYCFGSFLLQVSNICFRGTKYDILFTVNVLLTCILITAIIFALIRVSSETKSLLLRESYTCLEKF